MPGELHYNFTSLSVCSCCPLLCYYLSDILDSDPKCIKKEHLQFWYFLSKIWFLSIYFLVINKSAQISCCSDLALSTTIWLCCENVTGFEDAKNACCGLGKYGGMKGCLSPDMACHRASNHVWWDLYNPTEAVNILLANSAWSGDPLSSICRPITFKALGSSSY